MIETTHRVLASRHSTLRCPSTNASSRTPILRQKYLIATRYVNVACLSVDSGSDLSLSSLSKLRSLKPASGRSAPSALEVPPQFAVLKRQRCGHAHRE